MSVRSVQNEFMQLIFCHPALDSRFKFIHTVFLMNCNNFLFWLDILYLVVNNPYTHILGFWKKEEFYREVPTVHFKKQFLVVLELEQEGSFITYSTYQRYNQLQQQNIRIPLIQVLNLIIEFDWWIHIPVCQ